jgi:hypothetical protein
MDAMSTLLLLLLLRVGGAVPTRVVLLVLEAGARC